MPEITELLKEWNTGDTVARDKLMRLVIPELKKMAHRYMRRERAGHVLETAGLVNEAMIRLIRENLTLVNRKHFYAAVYLRMKQVLIRYAKNLTAPKQVGLSKAEGELQETAAKFLELQEAVRKFARQYKREAKVFKYRFLGLSLEEIAQTLGIGVKTVQRDLRFAQAWLRNYLKEKSGPVPSRS